MGCIFFMSGTIPEHTVLTGSGKEPKEFVNIIAAVSSAGFSGKQVDQRG
jgi:hypothetical protein